MLGDVSHLGYGFSTLAGKLVQAGVLLWEHHHFGVQVGAPTFCWRCVGATALEPCLQPGRVFLKDCVRFFFGFFFWSCCGRLPSGWPTCSSTVLTTLATAVAAQLCKLATCKCSPSFLPSFLAAFFPSLPFLPSFLPSFLSSFLHHISKARIANSHKSKKQQKPTEAFESQHKSPKANRSQQKPTEASNSYQKPLKATRSQQKPPEATKIPQKPTKATKSE